MQRSRKEGAAVNCMKCGRETQDQQVFCSSCLEVMEKYPVKPGTAVQLPKEKDGHTPKRSQPRRRSPMRAEERIRALKRHIWALTVLWLITLALLVAALYPTVEYFLGKTYHLPGQNYSTVTATESTQP